MTSYVIVFQFLSTLAYPVAAQQLIFIKISYQNIKTEIKIFFHQKI